MATAFKSSKRFRTALEDAAAAERRNLSSFIINALCDYLERKHGVDPAEILKPDDDKQ